MGHPQWRKAAQRWCGSGVRQTHTHERVHILPHAHAGEEARPPAPGFPGVPPKAPSLAEPSRGLVFVQGRQLRGERGRACGPRVPPPSPVSAPRARLPLGSHVFPTAVQQAAPRARLGGRSVGVRLPGMRGKSQVHRGGNRRGSRSAPVTPKGGPKPMWPGSSSPGGVCLLQRLRVRETPRG